MSCPDANTILAFVDGRLGEPDRSQIKAHLDLCEPCLDLVAEAIGRQSVDAALPGRALAPALTKGASVGRYVILGLVGRGGMGEVYEAYDPKLGRRIALKLLNDRAASPLSVARFSREAQAIARLSHPNVVAIHDAGDFDNRRFLAMEFVEGQTLADWLGAGPRSWRELRQVFMAAGAGLAAAHEAGLVHRDFKPQNVMVGNDGAVRVTDFGLATDASEIETGDAAAFEPSRAAAEPTAQTVALTRTGALLGTPLYMAPEQFRGKSTDARTDQFSFCVALYEGLYGERPFASQSLALLIEAVVAGDIRPLRARARVPLFLRKLLLRGLSPDPASRFASMQALLEALRFDPQRRRGRIAVGAIVAVVALAAAAGGQRLSRRGQRTCRSAGDRLAGIWELAEHGERREAIHRAFRRIGKGFAEDAWNHLAAVLDDYGRRWNETYKDACEATHVRGDQSVEVLELRMACLEGPRRAFKALTDTLWEAPPGALVEAINAAHALPPLDRCSDVPALQAVVPAPADAATRARVAALRRHLAEVKALTDTGQWPAARLDAGPLVAAARAVGYGPLLVETLATSGWLEVKSGAPSEAARIYQEAVWAALAVHRDDIAAESASILVGIEGYYLGRAPDAERWAQVGDALLQRLGPGHQRTASWFYQGRAIALQRKGEYQAALTDLDLALSLKRAVFPPNPPDIADTLFTMANVRNEIGDHQAALAAANDAVEIFQDAYGAESPLVGNPLGIRGETFSLLGRYTEAERDLRRAIELSSAWVGPDHPWTAYPLTALGKTLIGERRWPAAIGVLEQALRIRERSEPNLELLAETQFALARARWLAGQDRAGARALATTARDVYDGVAGHGKQVRDIDAWLADTWR